MLIAAATLILALGGGEPAGGVIDGGDALYGATAIGGPHCISGPLTDFINVGCGVVYRLTYDGSDYTVIHAFAGPDGRKPVGSLLLGPHGELYGRTAAGGMHSTGVIYLLARDGKQFRTLYNFPSQNPENPPNAPPIVRIDLGVIFAVAADAQNVQRIVRITQGTAATFASFGAGTEIADMQVRDGRVYVLAHRQGRCGAYIERFNPAGIATPLVTDSLQIGSGPCVHGKDYAAILPDDRDGVYALASHYGFSLEPLRIDRVERGHVIPFFAGPAPDPHDFSWQDVRATALGQGPDGRVLVTISPHPNLNCGVILSIEAAGHARTEAVLPPAERASSLSCSQPEEQSLTLMRSGDLYGTTPGRDCVDYAASLLDSCGSVFVLRRSGGLYTIHSFAARLRTDPSASPPPQYFYDVLQTTPDLRHLLLTRISNLENRPAQTPSPQPIELKSFETSAVTPLRLDGATMMRSIVQPSNPPVPALAYRLPRVQVGMYQLSLPLNDVGTTQVYFTAPLAPPALHDGQKFLALADVMAQFEPMTDMQGKPLGTSPIVLVYHHNDLFRFRVTGTGEVVVFTGRHAAVTDIPGLTPVVEGPAVERLREQYVGRTVSALQLMGTCVRPPGDTMLMRVEGSLRVRTIYRLYGVATMMTSNASGAGGPFAFNAINPLVLIFHRPTHARMVSGTGDVIMSGPKNCFEFYAFAADPWHIDHMILLRPKIDPQWPIKYQEAVKKGDVLLGMTRDMVVSAIGYPPAYAPAQALNKLDDWEYEVPSQQHEVFFKNNRVVRYDPPGQIP